jgi:hypothetical protein
MRKKKTNCQDINSSKDKDETRPRVYKLSLTHDEFGKYIPYCDFTWHRGIVFNPEICQKRNCQHYKRMYVQATIYSRNDLRTTIEKALEEKE